MFFLTSYKCRDLNAGLQDLIPTFGEEGLPGTPSPSATLLLSTVHRGVLARHGNPNDVAEAGDDVAWAIAQVLGFDFVETPGCSASIITTQADKGYTRQS